jgi:probable F420-dependent oxidoreductase
LARAAEERGFSALLFGEHTHVPRSRETEFPTGTQLPAKYRRTLDPFISLGAAAEATTSLRLGTGVCLLAQRDPILTAKAFATLDVLSGGRSMFGVGFGWNREEMANHGLRFEDRHAALREKLDTVIRLWTDEVAQFEGSHVTLSETWCEPKPLQTPHPPVLIGGNGSLARKLAVDRGFTWLPHVRTPEDVTQLAEWTRSENGVDAPAIDVTPMLTEPSREILAALEDAGVSRALLLLEAATVESSPARTLADLDTYASWI